jgi:hypothetical protein
VYGGAAWALPFAAASFYWAAGGTIGVPRGPGSVAVSWFTGALETIAAVLLLALIGQWAESSPAWIPFVAA